MVLAWARTIKVLDGIGLNVENREQDEFAFHLDALYNRIDKSWDESPVSVQRGIVLFLSVRSRFAETIPYQLSSGQLRLILIG